MHHVTGLWGSKLSRVWRALGHNQVAFSGMLSYLLSRGNREL
jgi:hypothetical protein